MVSTKETVNYKVDQVLFFKVHVIWIQIAESTNDLELENHALQLIVIQISKNIQYGIESSSIGV